METPTTQDATPGADERRLRAQAWRRSLICSGAGYALLGRRAIAAFSYLGWVVVMCVMAYLILAVGLRAMWTLLGLLGFGALVGVAEQMAVKRLTLRPPKPAFLVRGFYAATTVSGLAAFLVLIALVSRFGSLKMAGSGMSPTLQNGERLFYEKQVTHGRLRRGSVIVYRVSPRSAWGKPGWLVISRILAVPGDRLSIRGGKYELNGEAGPHVVETQQDGSVLQVPHAPESLTLQENCFFVIQDQQTAFDSRVLSWVMTAEIVSTELYYFVRRGILKPVD